MSGTVQGVSNHEQEWLRTILVELGFTSLRELHLSSASYLSPTPRKGVHQLWGQGNPIYNIYGCPKHRNWQVLLPIHSSPNNEPDVLFYIPVRRSKWTFQLRSDIISANSLMCIEVKSSSPSFLVFNVYNDTDNKQGKPGVRGLNF